MKQEFFHETVSMLRQWGCDAPIIAGGPYASSDYDTILKDKNVDLVVLGEGEYTLAELIETMLKNDFQLPEKDTLDRIPGIAFRKEQVTANQSREILMLDNISKTIDGKKSENAPSITSGAAPAYVMYTSGSTGKPKGVIVEHSQVNNCISWMQDKFKLDQGDVIVNRTNLSFDPSVWELFWPLQVGASVKILDHRQRKDTEYLIRLMAENSGLTMMYCPASLVSAMTYLLETKSQDIHLKLPWLIIGAEPIDMNVVKGFYSYYKGRIVNTYGPTECTINNTYYDLDPGDSRSIVPIGKPVANNEIYILSPGLQLMPVRIPGEIYIAGSSVARGYINNVEKTNQTFIDNPFKEGKLYKTGDIGRWLQDGTIEIMGRVDEQVKIRGYRIEPGEINASILTHSAVNDCVVVVKDNSTSTADIKKCKYCGITSVYPGIKIDDDTCNVCQHMGTYKNNINNYFKTLADLKQVIEEANKEAQGTYDCLILYNGGRGAAYALYQLLDLGFRVLVVTYDNGYFSKADLRNIEMITSKLDVDHVVLKHENTNQVLKESLKTAHTVCRGCFHISASLAAEYAYKNNIKVVVGATLSRGQIIENKLFMFLQQGMTHVKDIENEISKFQKNLVQIDKNMFDYIDIDVVNNGSVYHRVTTIDLYRYCDISNKDMISYLNNRDPYWKTRKNYAVYSTNCPIKQMGDYAHLEDGGFHFYGSATSWEVRLEHITVRNVEEDLACRVTPKGYENFLKRLQYKKEWKIEDKEKKLYAYIVPNGELEIPALRESLSQRLPAYMIPSHFVLLEKIPLTANGKIDFRALPAGDEAVIGSNVEYVEPTNDVEKKLLKVWGEILGRTINGINENFFENGGDSVKAIQIASKMNVEGYELSIRDIFQYPVLAKLAPKVRRMTRTADKSPITGVLPLTPMQHWFFENKFTHSHHWNHSVMLYREEGFDPGILEILLTRIVEHHDALRMVFEIQGDNVIQRNRGLEGRLFDFEIIELEGSDNGTIEADINKTANRVQASISLATGPLVKSVLFKTGQGHYLLLVIHHLVVDGLSWRIILEDFTLGYQQLKEGKEIAFQAKTDSFKYWLEKLLEYAESKEVLRELLYWQEVVRQVQDGGTPPGRVTVAAGKRKKKDTETVTVSLAEEDTGKLLKEANQPFNTETNDLLLAALGMALQGCSGLEKFLVNLEWHGRQEVLNDVNIHRTVGWFTSQYPFLLDIGKSETLHTIIPHVKEMLRKVPNRGLGYGILKYLAPLEEKSRLLLEVTPGINFNYWGQFDGHDFPADNHFQLSTMPTGELVSPHSEEIYSLNISGWIMDNRLEFSFAYNKNEYHRSDIEGLASLFKLKLLEMIRYCCKEEEVTLTPSDVGDSDLTFEELEKIEDIFKEPIRSVNNEK
jgi:amino acid adenylation domain-containing protein/non-ribosomal peptide synthase protein (TIGR01720 family)